MYSKCGAVALYDKSADGKDTLVEHTLCVSTHSGVHSVFVTHLTLP